MDDYIGLAIPTTQRQLDHVANGVMCAKHDVFPPNPNDNDDPISFKKLLKLDGAWDILKELLGFIFNGDDKTMWLMEGNKMP